jgi:hypothetical protein
MKLNGTGNDRTLKSFLSLLASVGMGLFSLFLFEHKQSLPLRRRAQRRTCWTTERNFHRHVSLRLYFNCIYTYTHLIELPFLLWEFGKG